MVDKPRRRRGGGDAGGATVEMRVEESEVVGWIDRVMGKRFWPQLEKSPEKFFGSGGEAVVAGIRPVVAAEK
ncbi:hypothetical protein Tco_0065817 [Tanacetum coccineum]